MTAAFKIRHPAFNGFAVYFDENIARSLSGMEYAREWRSRIGLMFATLVVLMGIGYSYLTGVDETWGIRILVFFVLLPAAVYIMLISPALGRTKSYLVRAVSTYLGWEYAAKSKSQKLARRLSQHQLLPNFRSAKFGDYLRGMHQEWPFEYRQLKLSIGSGSDVKSVFSGYIISVDVAGKGIGENGFVIARGKFPDLPGIMCPRFKAMFEELDTAARHTDIKCLIENGKLHVPIIAGSKFQLSARRLAHNDPERVQSMIDDFSAVLNRLDIILKPRACPATGEVALPKFRA